MVGPFVTFECRFYSDVAAHVPDAVSIQGPLHNLTSLSGPRKVVEFAYMRGGSSLIGQVFNNIQNSIYW